MIEQMTHVAVVSNMADKDALLRWLYGERCFHVMPIEDNKELWGESFSLLADDSQAIDANLTRLNAVVSFCQEYNSNKPGFIDAMLPLKVMGTKAEISAAVQDIDIDALYDKTSAMRASIEASNENLSRLQNLKKSVEQFAFLGDNLPKLHNLKYFAMEVVAVNVQGGKAFLQDERIKDGKVLAEELTADQTHAYFALFTPQDDTGALRGIIDDHGLHVQTLPRIKHGAEQELLLLNNDIMEANAGLNKKKGEAGKFSDSWLRKSSLAAGHYESEKNLAQLRTGMTASSHLFVARGYARTEELERFKIRLEEKIPGSTFLACEAPAGEEPPISMKWNKWISPASLLVKMYGLPSYKGIDPTPYVATIFFAFVGICLGDAAYGIILMLMMNRLKKKYREQTHLRDFFQCFTYCGITTFIVGLFTGSFFGGIFAKLPGLEWVDRIATSIKMIDPIKDSQQALYIAIGIGVFTLIYGMVLRMHRDMRRGDKMGALSDGLLWIGFLVFALLGGLTGISFFWVLFVLCVIALVLTQGRDQKTLAGKVVVGVVSLYGIVGAYGASALLGDLISFARLMALCLTGAALGSTFNMLAELSVGIPFVGILVAVPLAVGGHAMNFFLNLLGGFVHSARLIMLEFFGRFYEDGGYAYKPYGFASEMVGEKNN